MDKEERKALIEEVASAWRASTEEGVEAHPGWEKLDEAGRIEAFEIAESLRKMEAALDLDGLSTTGRVVLERVRQQVRSDLAPADVVKLDDVRKGSGQPSPTRETGLATVISFPKRIVQSQPWAMAAVALLVVGVGVWAVRERQGPGTGSIDQEQLAATEEQPREQERAQPVAKPPEAGEVVQERDERVEVAEAKPQEPSLEKRRRRRRREQLAQPAQKAEKEAREERPALAVKEPTPIKDEPAPEQEPPKLEAFAEGSPDDKGSAQALSGGEQTTGATEQELKICRARASVVEKLVSQNKDYEPAPEEQLAVGRCYSVLGKKDKAKHWLRRAARHPKTKTRAEKTLRELDAE